jgi:hypothetical protein
VLLAGFNYHYNPTSLSGFAVNLLVGRIQNGMGEAVRRLAPEGQLMAGAQVIGAGFDEVPLQ